MENNSKYNELFKDAKSKAEAFDKIAACFYNMNFGTMQKSDFETLMFSIYINKILEQSEQDFSTYSNYNLSKQLGITQSRIENLKIRKQLLYPREYEWKKSFSKIASNAIYENGKIKIFIPDKNLFLEIQNAIEENDGFIDVQLNSKLLQIAPCYFIDLMLLVEDEGNRDKLKKQIKSKLKEKNLESEYIEKDSFGKALLKESTNFIAEIIEVCIPTIGPTISKLIKQGTKIIKGE